MSCKFPPPESSVLSWSTVSPPAPPTTFAKKSWTTSPPALDASPLLAFGALLNNPARGPKGFFLLLAFFDERVRLAGPPPLDFFSSAEVENT